MSGTGGSPVPHQHIARVCIAAAQALNNDPDEAAATIGRLPDDAALALFGAVLAVISRSAQLLGVPVDEYAEELALFYGLGATDL